MTLYEIAVYDLMIPTLFIFLAGLVYRLSKYVLTYERRQGPTWRHRSALHRTYVFVSGFTYAIWAAAKKAKSSFVAGLILLHTLGVIPILFLLSPHINWWSYYFPPYEILRPLAIPPSITSSTLTLTAPVTPVSSMSYNFVNTLWGPLTVILNGDLLAIIAIIATAYKIGEKTIQRLVEHLQRVRIGDFIALILLLVILVSGYLATHHLPSDDVVTYKNVLGLHILSAEVLVMILPFTKFFHFVFGFWYGKLHEIYDMWRRGI